MNKKRFQLISILIVTSILITISFQAYWSYENYQENKRQLISELQVTLDQSLEAYFASRARHNFAFFQNNKGNTRVYTHFSDSLMFRSDSINQVFKKELSRPSMISSISIISDSLRKPLNRKENIIIAQNSTTFDANLEFPDSIDTPKDVELLASKIIVSLKEDSVNMQKLDSIFRVQLDRKSISIAYRLIQKNMIKDGVKEPRIPPQTIFATSSFLPGGNLIEVSYQNLTLSVLKRSLAGLSISVLVAGFIVVSLLFLYRIIKNQKELAIVKNDLINNITHEFKTPIATVLTALEGIKNFNEEKDQAKSDRYIDLSTAQLKKLNEMVEKLLETATLDNQGIVINKQQSDISELLRKIVNRYEVITDKLITLNLPSHAIEHRIDIFHMENAINNLMDNAIKYGGDEIKVAVKKSNEKLTITIADNGGKIGAQHRKKVFDKFYRIPTGNVHDVKGFGIGLFYTKKIIEQQGGSIQLEVKNNQTIFKITLP